MNAIVTLPDFVSKSLRRNAAYLQQPQKKLSVSTSGFDYTFWRDETNGVVLGTVRKGRGISDVDPTLIAAAMA